MTLEERKWNFEATGDSIYVCRDLHEKGDKCDYEKMTVQEVLELIEKFRSTILDMEVNNGSPI